MSNEAEGAQTEAPETTQAPAPETDAPETATQGEPVQAEDGDE